MTEPCCDRHVGWTPGEQRAAHDEEASLAALVGGVLLASIVVAVGCLGGVLWLLWTVMA